MHHVPSRIVPVALVALVAALALAIGACTAAAGGLTGKTWQWTGSTFPGAETVADPASYTVQFNQDGTLQARADCNQVAGEYTTTGTSITITPGASTLAMCAEGSLGDAFVAGLARATTWSVVDGELTLTGPEGAMSLR